MPVSCPTIPDVLIRSVGKRVGHIRELEVVVFDITNDDSYVDPRETLGSRLGPRLRTIHGRVTGEVLQF